MKFVNTLDNFEENDLNDEEQNQACSDEIDRLNSMIQRYEKYLRPLTLTEVKNRAAKLDRATNQNKSMMSMLRTQPTIPSFDVGRLSGSSADNNENGPNKTSFGKSTFRALGTLLGTKKKTTKEELDNSLDFSMESPGKEREGAFV